MGSTDEKTCFLWEIHFWSENTNENKPRKIQAVREQIIAEQMGMIMLVNTMQRKKKQWYSPEKQK